MSAPKTDATGQIVKMEDGSGGLAKLLARSWPKIAAAIPRHVTSDRMASVAMTALRTNRDLQKCTPMSFLSAVMQASQLGLEINTRMMHAFLIPYENKRKGEYECSLVIGYQGFIELATRSGRVSSIKATAAYEGDRFEYEEGLNPVLRHVPGRNTDRSPGKLTHVYAIARLKDGEREFAVLDKSQVEDRRKRGGNRRLSPWDTDYEAMAAKSAVRALWKWLPKSPELAQAEAIEVAAETHTPVNDPEINDMLASQGLGAVGGGGDDA